MSEDMKIVGEDFDAEKFAEQNLPMVQRWSDEINAMFVRWIDEGQKANLPYPTVVPLIRYVVRENLKIVNEGNRKQMRKYKKLVEMHQKDERTNS